MNVVVLVKYVPEPQGTPTLGEDNLLVREGVEGSLDPGDEFAVEAALQLVEAHGGEISVEDRPGPGSQFRLRLPSLGQGG